MCFYQSKGTILSDQSSLHGFLTKVKVHHLIGLGIHFDVKLELSVDRSKF